MVSFVDTSSWSMLVDRRFRFKNVTLVILSSSGDKSKNRVRFVNIGFNLICNSTYDYLWPRPLKRGLKQVVDSLPTVCQIKIDVRYNLQWLVRTTHYDALTLFFKIKVRKNKYKLLIYNVYNCVNTVQLCPLLFLLCYENKKYYY